MLLFKKYFKIFTSIFVSKNKKIIKIFLNFEESVSMQDYFFLALDKCLHIKLLSLNYELYLIPKIIFKFNLSTVK